MVISFMLHASKRLPHHCPGSMEKPDQERVFVAALCQYKLLKVLELVNEINLSGIIHGG